MWTQNVAFQHSFMMTFPEKTSDQHHPETEDNSRGVPGDELVAVHERGQGPDGAVLGVQHLELEAALMGVGQAPGHVEAGASL